MSSVGAFSLRIFVADGNPDGLRVVERSNWIGKALVFPSAQLPRAKARDELNQTEVYRFTQDYAFSSPSTAAAVVLGRSANGRIEWKDAHGRTLKWLQEQEAARG